MNFTWTGAAGEGDNCHRPLHASVETEVFVRPDKQINHFNETLPLHQVNCVGDGACKLTPEQLRNRQIRKQLRAFCENTTLRGVPRIVKATTLNMRILWSSFVFILFFGCTVCMVFLCKQFLEYDVMHPPRVLQDRLTPFPSVTICNLRAMSTRGEDTLKQKRWRTPREYSFALLSYAEEMYYHKGNKTMYTLASSVAALPGFLESVPSETQQQLGHSAEDFIIFCQMTFLNGSSRIFNQCHNLGKWRAFIHPQYLNCYTFILKEEFVKRAKTMEMYIYLDDGGESLRCVDCFNFDMKTQLSGALIAIHTPRTFPDTYQETINLTPGSLTEVKLKTIERKHKSHPYGRCAMDAPSYINMYNRTYVYSEYACRMMTIQDHINDDCQCMAIEFPLSDKPLPFCGRMAPFLDRDRCPPLTPNITLAELSPPQRRCLQALNLAAGRVGCKIRVMSEYQMDVVASCKLPCSSFTYEVDHSTSTWPTKRWQLGWLAGKRSIKLRNRTELSDYRLANYYLRNNQERLAAAIVYNTTLLERNLLAVVVNKPNFNLHLVEEKEVLSLTSFLSQSGGLFSMWIGLTMINLVELIELIIRCVEVGRTRYVDDNDYSV